MNKRTATVLKFTSSNAVNTNKGFQKTHDSQRAQHFVVLMAESEVTHTNGFLEFLSSFRPKIILDLRLSPRLDFAGGSRRRAFRAFEELSVQYIDVLGRLGVSSREDFFSLNQDATPTLFSWIEADNLDDRPIVCLYADETIVNECEKIFKEDIQWYKLQRPETFVSQFRAGLLAL